MKVELNKCNFLNFKFRIRTPDNFYYLEREISIQEKALDYSVSFALFKVLFKAICISKKDNLGFHFQSYLSSDDRNYFDDNSLFRFIVDNNSRQIDFELGNELKKDKASLSLVVKRSGQVGFNYQLLKRDNMLSEASRIFEMFTELNK
jgi:hypothetical protein